MKKLMTVVFCLTIAVGYAFALEGRFPGAENLREARLMDLYEQYAECKHQGLECLDILALIEQLENEVGPLTDRGPANLDEALQGGDNCSDATDLGSAFGTWTGSTDGYANDYGPYPSTPDCWQGQWFESNGNGSSNSSDVTYRWIAPYTGAFTFSLCGNNDYDTGLALYDFTCPAEPNYPGDFICGNDDACNLRSRLECIELSQFDTVLVVVDGWSSSEGDYELTIEPCVNCDFPVYCGGPTETEPNNSCGSPDPTQLNCFSDIYGFLCAEDNEEDFYCVQILPLNRITITVFDGPNCDQNPTQEVRFDYYNSACEDVFQTVNTQIVLENTHPAQIRTIYLRVLERSGGGDNTTYRVVTTCEQIAPPPEGRCCYYDEQTGRNCANNFLEECEALSGNWDPQLTCEEESCPLCGPMDIVFAVDVTQSMEAAIENVKDELPTIINSALLASDGDLYLGLVTFRDDIVTPLHNLTSDIAAVQATINGLSTFATSNIPESSDQALKEIITRDGDCVSGSEFTSLFRPAAAKIIVLITDAPPGGCDEVYNIGEDDVNAHQRALDAFAQGIRISAIYLPTVPYGDPAAIPVMQDYAATSGGIYLEGAADGSGTGHAINQIIEECGGCEAPDTVRITSDLPNLIGCVCLDLCANQPLTICVGPGLHDYEVPVHSWTLGCSIGECDEDCAPLSQDPAASDWIYDASTGSFYLTLIASGEGCLCFCIDDYLPVELTNFDAIAGDGEITLNWTTASETDNDHFDILRDGRTFGRVHASNSATGFSYSWTDVNLTNGREYSYDLVTVGISGVSEVIASVNATPTVTSGTVTEYSLHQNYPNPFNPETSISFDLLEGGMVSLTVYNPLGQTVATLANGTMESGRHTIEFNAADLPSGLYFYRLNTADFTAIRKMVLMK